MTSLAQDLAMEQALHDMAPLTQITPSAGTVSGRTQYKKLTDNERAAIGKFATEHSSTRAARQYGANESTVRGIKRKYGEALLEAEPNQVVTSLPKGKQGRPFILGESMDCEVQDFIRTQRSNGAIVTRSTVIAIGKGHETQQVPSE